MLGAFSAFARIAGAAAPWIGSQTGSTTLYTFGGLALLAMLASFVLTETLNFPLPDTFEDVQRMVDAKPWWSSISRRKTRTSQNEEEENGHEMENLQDEDEDDNKGELSPRGDDDNSS